MHKNFQGQIVQNAFTITCFLSSIWYGSTLTSSLGLYESFGHFPSLKIKLSLLCDLLLKPKYKHAERKSIEMNIKATLACFIPKNCCMFLTPNIESSLDKGDGKEIITLDFLSDDEYPLFQRLFLSISCIILWALSSLSVFCFHWYPFVDISLFESNYCNFISSQPEFAWSSSLLQNVRCLDFLPTWRSFPNSLLLKIMIRSILRLKYGPAIPWNNNILEGKWV